MVRESHSSSLFFLAAIITGTLATVAFIEVLFLNQLGASFSLIGSLLGPAAVAYLLLAPKLRIIAERIGRSHFIQWSLLLMGLSLIWASIISNPALYLIIKIIIFLCGFVLLEVIHETLTEVYRFHQNNQKTGMSIQASALLGTAIYFLIAWVLIQASFSLIYVVNGIILVIAGIASWWLASDPVKRYKRKSLDSFTHAFNLLSSEHSTIAAIFFSFTLFFVTRDFVYPYFLFMSGVAPANIVLLFFGYTLTTVIGYYIVHRLLLLNNVTHIITWQTLIAGVSLFLLVFVPPKFGMILYLLFGLTSGAIFSVIQKYITEEVSRDRFELYNSGLRILGGVAWIVAPLISGILLEAGVSPRIVLAIPALLLLYMFIIARSRWSSFRYVPKLTVKKDLGLNWKF